MHSNKIDRASLSGKYSMLAIFQAKKKPSVGLLCLEDYKNSFGAWPVHQSIMKAMKLVSWKITM